MPKALKLEKETEKLGRNYSCMILFKTISSFRKRIATLLKVRRNVYAGVISEIQKEFGEKQIEQIR